MAKFETNRLAEFSVSMAELERLPDSLFEDMLNAEADIIEPAQKARAPRDTGTMAGSIRRSKAKFGKNGRLMYVYPQGSRTRGGTATRNAEIAFINEFGKHGQPARPFIREANEANAEKAVDAAERVYDNYLKSKNL